MAKSRNKNFQAQFLFHTTIKAIYQKVLPPTKILTQTIKAISLIFFINKQICFYILMSSFDFGMKQKLCLKILIRIFGHSQRSTILSTVSQSPIYTFLEPQPLLAVKNHQELNVVEREKISQTIAEMEQVLQSLKRIENETSPRNSSSPTGQMPLILHQFCSEYSNTTNDLTLL